MHTFTIKIGDSYGDGHGKHDSFLVKSSKPIKEVQKAYKKSTKKLPSCLNPTAFMDEFEDGSLPKTTYQEALRLGYNFYKGFVGEPDLDYPDINPSLFCEYVLWYIKQSDPELELSIDNPPVLDTGGSIGYGLYWSFSLI